VAGHVILKAVIMPASTPFGPVTWARMWQWYSHTPGRLAVKTASDISPGAMSCVNIGSGRTRGSRPR
jgi:hypothetical protein